MGSVAAPNYSLEPTWLYREVGMLLEPAAEFLGVATEPISPSGSARTVIRENAMGRAI